MTPTQDRLDTVYVYEMHKSRMATHVRSLKAKKSKNETSDVVDFLRARFGRVSLVANLVLLVPELWLHSISR